MSDWLCKDCGEEFMGRDCRCVRRMKKDLPALKEEAMTEPKRDEAQELEQPK